MANQSTSTNSFLKEAFNSFATYSNLQKQDVQRQALKWLQLHIETDLADKTIIPQFNQMWRGGVLSSNADSSPLYLENLPGSYKGSKTLNNHQEDALAFIQEKVPQELQDEFKKRWEAKTKIVVSNAEGAVFKIDEREITVLQAEDSEGNGTAWFKVENKQMYYLVSSEEKGNDFYVVLCAEVSPQNRNAWYVAQSDVKISNI
ncbi:hypothetical protein ACE1B6_21765 [Aerosakkonemataceae cyanobacterium BLCC-F154]|uniref:Uncharacterized protein n=1 Tax=Floridaenema fluviatile BLCC-F154 TaxID=3153640 RepID=A0ABV4YGD6_9CYAN